LSGELVSKQLELLHELARKPTIVAALVNPTNPGLAETVSKELRAAANTLGLQLHVLSASSEREIETAFANLLSLKAGGLVIGADGFFSARSENLAAMAVRHAVPAISPYRPFVEAGGLMRYGTNAVDGFRLAGIYTGRILKGEKPIFRSFNRPSLNLLST
jgi:putative ABC transport system substrate-binding protein